MSSFTHTTTLLHAHQQQQKEIGFNLLGHFNGGACRSSCTAAAPSAGPELGDPARSFLREHFFELGLSPEDSVARIKQTAEGLHSMREMLENMSWRYVIFYIRLKAAYLDQDLKTVMATLPQGLRKDYVKVANELVDNMAELDRYVRSPKVYESYLYYERTLKSIDDLVAMLA
ncbi:hypothetical protein K1719_002810 [Acacia pycnantha]|nr:hypothetical protein K1719_002810 [Acacia pycnantha]